MVYGDRAPRPTAPTREVVSLTWPWPSLPERGEGPGHGVRAVRRAARPPREIPRRSRDPGRIGRVVKVTREGPSLGVSVPPPRTAHERCAGRARLDRTGRDARLALATDAASEARGPETHDGRRRKQRRASFRVFVLLAHIGLVAFFVRRSSTSADPSGARLAVSFALARAESHLRCRSGCRCGWRAVTRPSIARHRCSACSSPSPHLRVISAIHRRRTLCGMKHLDAVFAVLAVVSAAAYVLMISTFVVGFLRGLQGGSPVAP